MDFFGNTGNYLQDIQEKIIKTDEVLRLLDGKKKELHKLDKKYKKLLEKFWVKNNEISIINTSWEKKVAELRTQNEEFVRKHYDYVNEAEKKYQFSCLEISELSKTCDNLKKKLEKFEQIEKFNLNSKKLQETCNETKEQLKESIRKYEELQISTNQIISELKNECKNQAEKKNETLKHLAKARLDCDELKKLQTNSPTKNRLKEEIKELESKLEYAEVEIDLLNQSYKNDSELLKKNHEQRIAKLKAELLTETNEKLTKKHEDEKKFLVDQMSEFRRKVTEENKKHIYEKKVLEEKITELKKIIEKERNTCSTQTEFEDIFNLEHILIDTRTVPLLTPISLEEDESSRTSEICEDGEEQQKEIQGRDEQQQQEIEEREEQQQQEIGDQPQKEIEEGELPQKEIEDQQDSLKDIEDISTQILENIPETGEQNRIKVRNSSELYLETPIVEKCLVESSTQTEDYQEIEFKFQPSIILPKNILFNNLPRTNKLKARITKRYKNNKNKMLSALKSSNLNLKNLMQNYLDTNNKIVIMSPSILNQNFDRGNCICQQSHLHNFVHNPLCFNSFNYNSHNYTSSRQFNHRNLINTSDSEEDIRDLLKDYKYRVINKYLSKNNWRRTKKVVNKFKHKSKTNLGNKKIKNYFKKRLISSSESNISDSENEKSNIKKTKKQTKASKINIKSSKYKRIVSNSESESETESEDNQNANLYKVAQNKNLFKQSNEKRNSGKSKINTNNSKNVVQNKLKKSKTNTNKTIIMSNSESSSEHENNAEFIFSKNTEIEKSKNSKNTIQNKIRKVNSKEIISDFESSSSEFEIIHNTNETKIVTLNQEQNKNMKNEKPTKISFNETVKLKYITPSSSITDDKSCAVVNEESKSVKGIEVENSSDAEINEEIYESTIKGSAKEITIMNEYTTKDVEETQESVLRKNMNINKNDENIEEIEAGNKNEDEKDKISLENREVLKNSSTISSDEDFKGFEPPIKNNINKNCKIIKKAEQTQKQNEGNKENETTKIDLAVKKNLNCLTMNKRQQTMLRKFAINNKINIPQIKKDDINTSISSQNNKRKPENSSYTPTKRMKLLLFGAESNSDSDDSNSSAVEAENSKTIKKIENVVEDINSNKQISFPQENETYCTRLTSNREKNVDNHEIIKIKNEITLPDDKELTNCKKMNKLNTTLEKERVFKKPERSKLIQSIRKEIVNKDSSNISFRDKPIDHIIYNTLDRPTEFKKESEHRNQKFSTGKNEILNKVVSNIYSENELVDHIIYNKLERPSSIEGNKETEPIIQEFSTDLSKQLILDVATLDWDEALIKTTANYLTEKDPEIVARLIINQAVKDFSQQFDKTFTPPAPLLTTVQQKILVLVNEIEQKLPNFHSVFVEAMEKRLLSENRVEVVHSLTRIYVTQCKLKYEIEKVRMFCCHAAYYIGDLVLPLMYIILTTWADVLPKSGSAEDLPLVIALIHIIQIKSCRKPGYNYRNLNQLLEVYYNYKILEYSNEQIMNKLINFYSASYSHSAYMSIVILCRNLPSKCTYTQIKNHLLPLLAKNEKNDMTLSLINRLIENFNMNVFSEQEYISDIKNHLAKYINEAH